MKKLSVIIGCLILMAGLTFGQSSIKLVNSGTGVNGTTALTINPSVTNTFSLDNFATFTGYTGVGLSFWIEVPTALAPFISITNEQYFTWTDSNQSGSNTGFGSTTGAEAGFNSENRDLGSTSTTDPNDSSIFLQAQSAGSYQTGTLNFTLAAGAPSGVFQIRTLVLSPRTSEITDNNFGGHNVGQSIFTLTIVPEPATWSLMGLGGLGAVGMTWLRARRK